jgi:hypothetical protein
MKYAHIYTAPGKRFRLFITISPTISEGVVSEQLFGDKSEAKKAAKAAGAKAWNF